MPATITGRGKKITEKEYLQIKSMLDYGVKIKAAKDFEDYKKSLQPVHIKAKAMPKTEMAKIQSQLNEMTAALIRIEDYLETKKANDKVNGWRFGSR